jgi:hypothetical protein
MSTQFGNALGDALRGFREGRLFIGSERQLHDLLHTVGVEANRKTDPRIHWFTAETSVDARIACDLEWEDDEEG